MKSKQKLGTIALVSTLSAVVGGQVSAQTVPSPTQVSGGLEINSEVGSVGWSDNATLALATSATPNAARYEHIYSHFAQYNDRTNEATGTVTVSAGENNTFVLGSPAAVSLLGGVGDLNLATVTPDELLYGAMVVSYALTPAISYTSYGNVTADLHTEGNASARGLGETLGYVDVTASNTTHLELSELGYSDLGEATSLPLSGATSETTARLFGGMDSDGLISRVSYGAEISGITGTELDIDGISVEQSVTASANNGSDFSFIRTVPGDLELSGNLDGNGMSMFQEADRTGIAGGGVKRSISFFATEPSV